MSRDYELGFILQPEVNEEQSRAILERIEQIVGNYGGQIMRVNQWGRRRLAYPIEHHRDGFYVFIDMILTPETVSELDRTLKVSEEVLRHMIKRRDPKAVQKEREARAAAAAAAQAQAQQAQANPASVSDAPVAEISGEDAGQTETPEEGSEQEGVEIAENETPVALTAEEDTYVPPAIEEETIEA